MKLHKNKDLYRTIVTATAEEFGIQESYVDKDYFVSLLLSNLARNIPNILFKGGTSLSKCFGIIDRYSEDIDLNLISDEAITTGDRRSLKRKIAETIEDSDMRLINPEEIRSRMDFNAYEVEYPKLFGASEILKSNIVIETYLSLKSFPHEKREATNYIYEFLKNENDFEMISKYTLEPFMISTQSVERTFIDKILAICDYHEKKTYTQYSRHLYDIHKIWTSQKFNPTSFVQLFYKIIEERRKKPEINHSSASGYQLLVKLQDIMTQECFKKDYNINTVRLIQDETTYEDTIESIEAIIRKGFLPEVIE